jgi:hypothetical protein
MDCKDQHPWALPTKYHLHTLLPCPELRHPKITPDTAKCPLGDQIALIENDCSKETGGLKLDFMSTTHWVNQPLHTSIPHHH